MNVFHCIQMCLLAYFNKKKRVYRLINNTIKAGLTFLVKFMNLLEIFKKGLFS